MPARKEQLLQAVQNPNVRMFLDLLAAAEGTEEHGYATAFGGSLLSSLDDHPRTRSSFTQTDGRRNETTAAGRYQFLERTWDDVAGKLGLTDFGPEAQDLAAVELLRRAGALDPIINGDFQTAIQRSGSTWASLPSSPYAQNKRSDAFIASRLPAAAGTTPPAWAAMLPKETQRPAASPPLKPVPIPGPAGTPSASVPATAPGAVGQLLALMAPRPTVSLEPGAEPEFTPEDDSMLALGLEADVSHLRNQAQAKFFGEDYTPEVALPPELDTVINRYLAQL